MADVLAEKLHLLLLVQQSGILEQYHRGQHVAADQRVKQHPCFPWCRAIHLSAVEHNVGRALDVLTRDERTQINGGSGADDGASVTAGPESRAHESGVPREERAVSFSRARRARPIG